MAADVVPEARDGRSRHHRWLERRLACSRALLRAVVGEFISSSEGLGHTIGQLQYQLDVAGSFAILVILAVIGLWVPECRPLGLSWEFVGDPGNADDE